MKRRGEDRPRLVVSIGPLPPPLNGASIVHDLVLTIIRRDCERVRVVDTSAAGHVGVRYHLIRVLLHVRALVLLLRVGVSGYRVGVYLTGSGGLGIWYLLPLVAVSRALGYSVVHHHHSFAYLNARKRSMGALVSIAGPGTLHVTLCEDMQSLLLRRYPTIRRSAVCSNAAFIRHDHGPRLASGSTGEIRLGHLSNLSASKGLDVVLAAHELALSAGFATHLHLAGPLADEAAEKALRAAQERHRGTITHHGALARPDIAAFLQELDVFLFPSRYRHEAEPLVVLEALAAGVPVLALGVGCLTSAFRGTRWLASDEATYHDRLQELLAELDALSPATVRQQFLRAAAAGLNARFGTADGAVVMAGLGLTHSSWERRGCR